MSPADPPEEERARPHPRRGGDLVFDPLDHPGIPVDHHGRHWHEFDIEPVDTRATDPDTRCRISMMAAVEANAERFDRQFSSRVRDADARRSVSSLGDATA